MGDRISALSQRSVSYLIAESAQRLLVLCRVHSAVRNLTMHKLLILIIAVSLTPFGRAQAVTPTPPPVEITTAMKIDVDGAPNAYGPKGKETLDYELNAHEGARATGAIVGYVTKKDGHTAETRDQVTPSPAITFQRPGSKTRAIQTRLTPRAILTPPK